MSSAEVAASVASGDPEKVSTRRFLNWKLIAIEGAVAAAGFYVLNVTTGQSLKIQGIVAALLGVVAIYLLLRELAGTTLDAEYICMPSNRVPWLPVISFGRRKLSIRDIRRISVGINWGGFQLVKITGAFGMDILVFQSRGQRRRFTKLLEVVRPDLPIYRSRSIPEA